MVRPVAVIDANVLYGIEVTDLLLTLATQRAIRVHWSDEMARRSEAEPRDSTGSVRRSDRVPADADESGVAIGARFRTR